MSPAAVESPPSINDLPAEVLLRIFRAFVGQLNTPTTARLGRIEENMERPLQLTHVCSSWRTTAIDDPSLWTNVHVNHWSLLYAEFFQRSSPLPIDLSINTISPSISSQKAQQIASELKKALDVSLTDEPHPAANRIRTLRLITDGPKGAIDFASILQKYELPSLTSFFVRPSGTELENRAYTHFKPLIRESITSLALYQLSRALSVRRLQNIFASCPRLETLVLGVLNLEGRRARSGGGANNASGQSTTYAPALKTLVVASPIFKYHFNQNRACTSGCPCFFRDLNASNLQYLEVAGEVSDALAHLTPLINRRAAQVTPEGHTLPLSTLKVMVNAGECEFDRPQRLLPSLSSNIHLHLYADSLCRIAENPTSAVGAWMRTTRSTTLYTALRPHPFPSSRPLASFPHLKPRLTSFPHKKPTRPMVPVLVHPTPGDPSWREAKIDPGPYHDPDTLDQMNDHFRPAHNSNYGWTDVPTSSSTADGATIW